ncbi:MAG: sulfotransferase [Aliiglaciecola sp.]
MINFIGIGAQKCASSWIYEVLKNSEQVCVSQTKELDFFSYYYDRGYQWYESNFSDHSRALTGEISPSYFYNSDVPERVHTYNPETKIILSLRDPIKRMYSNHLHEVRAGNISGKNTVFENAFENNPLYLQQSQYAVHIKKWQQYFPKEKMHIVFQEDVKRDPQKVSDEMCQFFEIEPLDLVEVNVVNASVQNKNKVVGKAFELGGDVLRKLELKGALNQLKESKLVGTVYNKNKVHISELVAPMKKETRTHLQALLAPQIEELKVLLNMDALPWEKETKLK